MGDKGKAILVASIVVGFILLGLVIPRLLGPTRVGNISSNVTLVVSENFGRTVIGKWEFDPGRGMTVMDMLRNVTEVETSYGGLFLHGMFGLTSKPQKQTDWLYYCNGVYMKKGLASYIPGPGEVVQVDYHHWGGFSFSPGFLSGYPSKLVYGLAGERRNTTILCSEEVVGLGSGLARNLEDLLGYRPEVFSGLQEDLNGNIILLATTYNCTLFRRFQEWNPNAMWPFVVEGGKIQLLNATSSQRSELEQGCAVQCMGFPNKDLWMVFLIGTNESWLKKGLASLNEGDGEKYACGFAVTPDGTINLPVI